MTVSLDDAFDCYEMSKRTMSKEPRFYYDFTVNKFVEIKSHMKNPGVIFINSYKLCSKLIDEYINKPEMQEYKNTFEKESYGPHDKIVKFLWHFEHIDGCYDFGKFEILRVTDELKKWCENNGLDYLEPEVYCVN